MHDWVAGDIVVWDNRCVLHRGLPYPVDQRRIMCRTTVAGDQSGNEWALGAARDAPSADGTPGSEETT